MATPPVSFCNNPTHNHPTSGAGLVIFLNLANAKQAVMGALLRDPKTVRDEIQKIFDHVMEVGKCDLLTLQALGSVCKEVYQNRVLKIAKKQKFLDSISPDTNPVGNDRVRFAVIQRWSQPVQTKIKGKCKITQQRLERVDYRFERLDSDKK